MTSEVSRSLFITMVLLIMANPVSAAIFSYEFSGVGDGSVGAVAFRDANFRIAVTGDTSTVKSGTTSGLMYVNAATPSSIIEVAGVGKGELLVPSISVAVQNKTDATGSHYLALNNLGNNLPGSRHAIQQVDPIFGSWQLNSTLGPLTNDSVNQSYLANFQEIPSTMGPITFTSMRSVTFVAAGRSLPRTPVGGGGVS